jgi:hypothetical protein
VASGGQWERGTVRFASASDFEQEFQGFISKGAVRIGGGEGLPVPLEPFGFQLLPPGGAPVPLRGMIVSQSGGVALVQILEFSPALVQSIRSGGTGTTLAPPLAPATAAPRPLPRITPNLETLPAADEPRDPTGKTPVPLLFRKIRTTLPPRPADPRPPPPTGPAAASESFEQNLDWATPSPLNASPAMTGVFPIVAAPPGAGPLAGLLVNPPGLDGLLQLPLGPIGAVRDLATVSTVGLLRFLGARRATGQLTLVGDAGGERRVPIDRGSFLLSPQEREALRPIFQWPGGRYVFELDTPDRPPHRLPTSAWRLVLDFVRLAIREARPDDLAVRVDSASAVRLTAAFAERARTLDLTPAEERLVRRDFNGQLGLREVYKLGGVAELTVQRLVLLLQALGLAELVTPEGDRGKGAVDEVRAHYERLLAGDLFAALGMHWSDPPERVPVALDAVRARYKPGTPAANASPEYAAKLIELAERAHRLLGDRASRRAYRTELGVDVRHGAELLVQQVPLAKARGEYRKAYELMSAACDLFDRTDWEKLRAELAHSSRPPA